MPSLSLHLLSQVHTIFYHCFLVDIAFLYMKNNPRLFLYSNAKVMLSKNFLPRHIKYLDICKKLLNIN